jgi:DNA end-binding protein Ku
MRRSSLLVLRQLSLRASGALPGLQDERQRVNALEEMIGMAARAIWKGSIDLGRAELPVKLYTGVEDRTVHFHLLEKRTHARVKQHMVNPSTSKEVRNDEIRKGYEIEPDTFVLVEEGDLKKIEPQPSTTIELTSFLPDGHIGHQYYDRPYYLRSGWRYENVLALAEALARKEREGLAHCTMRKKEYVGALRSSGGYLLLITLRHSEEVLTAREIGSPPGKAPDPREVKIAEQLVAVLEGEFRAEDYSDEYRNRVLKHIDAKAKGRKPKLEALPKPSPEPKSLMDAPAASLKSTGGKRKEKAVA